MSANYSNASQESSKALSQTEEPRHAGLDMTEFLETPILIYNAVSPPQLTSPSTQHRLDFTNIFWQNPCLENRTVEPDDITVNLSNYEQEKVRAYSWDWVGVLSCVQVGESTSNGYRSRKLRNGCVEYTDNETGQRLLFARERNLCFLDGTDSSIEFTPTALVTSHELAQEASWNTPEPLERLTEFNEDWRSAMESWKLRPILAGCSGIDDECGSCIQRTPPPSSSFQRTNCAALGLSNVPNFQTPTSADVSPISNAFSTSNKRMRLRENISPLEENGDYSAPGPLATNRPFQHFNVLNKELIHKKVGHNGQASNVEKVRVEMHTLEDGYR